MSGWLVSPERLREDAPRDSTRWCWWLYDENWQHRAKGVVATQTEALASARTAALNQPGASNAKHLDGQPADTEDRHNAARDSRKEPS